MNVGDVIEAEMITPKNEKKNEYFSKKDTRKNVVDLKKNNANISKTNMYNFMMIGIFFIVISYILKIRGYF
jgi:hypothetical protein